MQNLFTKRFSTDDQLNFALISGDHNPIHVDFLSARRSLFGKPVVHGIHLLIWALDRWLDTYPQKTHFQSIKTRFLKSVSINDPTHLELSKLDDTQVQMLIFKENAIAVRIDLQIAPGNEDKHSPFNALPKLEFPEAPQGDQLETAKGTLDLYLDQALAKKLFPKALRYMPSTQFATLLASTRLVGMKCPGLNSIYSELKLFSSRASTASSMSYHVSQYDKRFGLTTIDIKAPELEGTIRAITRPPIQNQRSYSSIKKLVAPDEFKEQRALIIGGSRGLGETTAKLLVAGGAQAWISYNQGKEEANALVQEIQKENKTINCFQLDVLKFKQGEPDSIPKEIKFTHLYFFATPFVSASLQSEFSVELFEKYCLYYVDSFLRISTEAIKSGVRQIFYPSTAEIEQGELDMPEYSSAKLEGENVCDILERETVGLSIHKPRLPRMSTDLTTSLLSRKRLDPSLILLDHLRKF